MDTPPPPGLSSGKWKCKLYWSQPNSWSPRYTFYVFESIISEKTRLLCRMICSTSPGVLVLRSLLVLMVVGRTYVVLIVLHPHPKILRRCTDVRLIPPLFFLSMYWSGHVIEGRYLWNRWSHFAKNLVIFLHKYPWIHPHLLDFHLSSENVSCTGHRPILDRPDIT